MHDDDFLRIQVEEAQITWNNQHGGDMFALSETSKKNRIGVDRRLIEISDRAIRITKVDFGHGRDAGVRTLERQSKLFANGVSKTDGVNNRSRHQDGKALDFTAYIDNKPVWEHKYYAMVMVAVLTAANELGYRVNCGIMFKTDKVVDGVTYGWDGPHVELID